MPVDWKELHLDESSPRFWGWVLDTHLSKFNSRLVMTQNQRSLLWGYTASMLCSWVFISRLSRLESPAKVNMAFQPTSSPLAFCFMKCSQECNGIFSSCSPKTFQILQPVRMHLTARTGALWWSQRSGSVFGHHGWPGSPRRSRMKLRCRKAAGDPMTLTLANSRTEKVDSVDCGK